MTDEEVLDKIDDWHFENAGVGLALHEYLGWTWEQFTQWVATGDIPKDS